MTAIQKKHKWAEEMEVGEKRSHECIRADSPREGPSGRFFCLQQPPRAKSEQSLSWHSATTNSNGLTLVPKRCQATLHSYLKQKISESFAPGRMRSFSFGGNPTLWLEKNDSHLNPCPMLWRVAGLLSELLWPIFTVVPLSISHLAGLAFIFSASSPLLADVRWKGRLAGGHCGFDISFLLPFASVPLACKSDKPAMKEDCYQISNLQDFF